LAIRTPQVERLDVERLDFLDEGDVGGERVGAREIGIDLESHDFVDGSHSAVTPRNRVVLVLGSLE